MGTRTDAPTRSDGDGEGMSQETPFKRGADGLVGAATAAASVRLDGQAQPDARAAGLLPPPPLPEFRQIGQLDVPAEDDGFDAANGRSPFSDSSGSDSSGSDSPGSRDAGGPERNTNDVGSDQQRRKAKRRAAGPSRDRIAANDDVPSIGGLIYALEQKPSKKTFSIAALASGLWFAFGCAFAWSMLAPEYAKVGSLGELLLRPVMMSVTATIVLPIVLFWFLALLVWRAQELRLMSSAMTEVAVRLAEPDRSAEQSVASLGQAVRKQVNFMNEAVSRALGRAGELEALVHNEVNALERSYQDNEHKIRGLVQELSGERTALVTSTEQMHVTLRSMGSEIPALVEKLSGQQIKLAKIIEGAGQNLIALETSLNKASNNLESSLGDRTVHLQSVLTDYTQALNGALANRTNQMQGVLEDYTRALDTTLANRAHMLDGQLVERTRALDSAFAERLKLFDDSILRSTMAIDGTIGEKAQLLTTAMESHAHHLSETLGKQAHNLDDTLMHGINAVRLTSENITRQSVKAIEGLSGQADLLKNVSENLLTQVNTVTGRFENQGQSIMRAANALETANFRIDTTLQNRHRELGETLNKLSSKAEQLDEVMRGYSTSVESSMTDAEMRARALTDQMARGAVSHSQAALAEIERVRMETEAHAGRALEDMRSKFANVSREVSEQMGTLTNRVSESSDDLRSRSMRAAAEFEHEQGRLRAEAERIPEVTRQSSEAMRRALSEQLQALEQLSSLSSREARHRDVRPPAPAPLQVQTLTQAVIAESRQHAPVMPQPPPPASTQNRWSLGDLLARASEDESGQRSHAAAGPAASAAINIDIIARAIDTNTAAAIWSRFRAGQRGIMVRSIYSAEGRTTFDEILRRYRTDLDFQGTVDRFLMDFESLLRDADQKDPSGQTVQGHLVSNSGRVYLFLAHASGRLS